MNRLKAVRAEKIQKVNNGHFHPMRRKAEATVEIILSRFFGVSKKHKEQCGDRRCAPAKIKQKCACGSASKSEDYGNESENPGPRKRNRKKEKQSFGRLGVF